MGLFSKLFGGHDDEAENIEETEELDDLEQAEEDDEDEAEKPASAAQMASEWGGDDDEPLVAFTANEMVEELLNNASAAMAEEDFEEAARTFKNILELEPNDTALQYLGGFYVQGKGVEQSFVEAARLFHVMEQNGNPLGERLVASCLIEQLSQGLGELTPEQAYQRALDFSEHVYPELDDVRGETLGSLFAVAMSKFDHDDYEGSAKLFRAAAEFGDDGDCQYYFAKLIQVGAGVPKNELAALYWFDRAVDNGAEELAGDDRNEILGRYRSELNPMEFAQRIGQLADWCEEGTTDVPRDPERAAYWRTMA